jgi:hypothetical protein
MNHLTYFILALQLATVSNGYGWGAGHDGVADLMVKHLPAEIREFFGEDALLKIPKWSHANDNFDAWDKVQERYCRFSEAEMGLIKEHGLSSMYSFHSAKGQAVCAILLTQAFRHKNSEHAAFWLTTLGHSIADEAACNHGPLLHYLTYYLQGGYKLRMGDGVGVDFHDAHKTERGRAVAEQLLAGFHPRVSVENPEEFLLRIMASGMAGNAYMTRRERAIAAAFSQEATSEIQDEGCIALIELGVYAVKHCLDAVVTAWHFAQKDTELAVSTELLANYSKELATVKANRPLADDSIYADLLEIPAASNPYVGFLIEPSISMNQARFSFLSKPLLSASMRSMKRAKRPFRALDYREFIDKPFPEPTAMPVIVLCAKATPGELKRSIEQYASAGGRILWIGKKQVKELGALSEAMQVMEPEELPVSPKYGSHGSEKVEKISITFAGDLAQAMGGKPYRFTQNPSTKAGWMKPACDVKIVPRNDRVTILATLTMGGDTINIAGTSLDEQGNRRATFLPEYLMSPFLFSRRKELADPSKMMLDEFTEALLFASLDLLLN